MTPAATSINRLASAAAVCGVKLKRLESDARKPLKLRPFERFWLKPCASSSRATAAPMRERRSSVGTLTDSSGAKAAEKKALSLSTPSRAEAHASHEAMCAAASAARSLESSPST